MADAGRQLTVRDSNIADKSDNSTDDSTDDAPLNQAKSAMLRQQESSQTQQNTSPLPNRFAGNDDLLQPVYHCASLSLC